MGRTWTSRRLSISVRIEGIIGTHPEEPLSSPEGNASATSNAAVATAVAIAPTEPTESTEPSFDGLC